MKYQFKMDTVIEAGSIEEAIDQVATHIKTVNRNVASERPLEDCGALFTLKEVAEKTKAVNISDDKAVKLHGPIELELDPASPEGIARVEQKAVEAEEKAAEEKRLTNAARSDAEIMAEHAAAEQEKLNAEIAAKDAEKSEEPVGKE